MLTLAEEPGWRLGQGAGEPPGLAGRGSARDRRALRPGRRRPLPRRAERRAGLLPNSDASIRYSLEPRRSRREPWSTYGEPIVLRESTRVRFVAERGERRSPVVEARFHRIPNDWSIESSLPSPTPQYTAGGPTALIDGLRGDANWRTGRLAGLPGDRLRGHGRSGRGAADPQRRRELPAGRALVDLDAGGGGALRLRRRRELSARWPGWPATWPTTRRASILRDIVVALTGRRGPLRPRAGAQLRHDPRLAPGPRRRAFIFVDEILID